MGNMIYDRISSICKAGIHTGVIKEEGGLVEMALSGEVERLYALENNGIFSFEVENAKHTFVVGKPNSIHL